MNEIMGVLQRPEWWFTTIVVAIGANLIASFLYDWLKSRTPETWGTIGFLGAKLAFSGSIAWCGLMLPLNEFGRFALLSTAGAGVIGTALEGFRILVFPHAGKVVTGQFCGMIALFGLILLGPALEAARHSGDMAWFAAQLLPGDIPFDRRRVLGPNGHHPQKRVALKNKRLSKGRATVFIGVVTGNFLEDQFLLIVGVE